MRVLVLESEPGVATATVERLTGAGHEIARCHDAGAPPFPCDALVEGHTCPLDDGPVSVALVVGRDQRHAGFADPASDAPTFADHDGARCAVRRHVPIVVAGHDDDVTSLIERAASTPLTAHSSAAADSLRTVLALHDLDPSLADAAVVRVGAELRVVLEPGMPLEHRVEEIAAVRALAAVRNVDPYAQNITVTVDD